MLSILMFFFVILLQAADAYLTWRILRGGGRELNPIVRWLMQRLGIAPGLSILKLLVILIAGIWILPHPIGLLAVVAVYAVVTAHNWRQLRHLEVN